MQRLVILIDAGPLIAIIDRGEPDHALCVEALSALIAPMITTWPAFTEAMYLLGSAGGWTAQDALWRLVARADLRVFDLDPTLQKRAQALMSKYQDIPMDFADASLVAAAEALNITRVFTLDSDFRVYRLKGRKAFDVVP